MAYEVVMFYHLHRPSCFLGTFTEYPYLEIVNFFDRRSTNAASESFNAKIKEFRTQFRGVKDRAFFLFRLTKIYAQSMNPSDFYVDPIYHQYKHKDTALTRFVVWEIAFYQIKRLPFWIVFCVTATGFKPVTG